MKKVFSILSVILVVTALSSTTVFAHGHCGGRKNATTKNTVCNIETCTLTGRHDHNKKSYVAHYSGDGHDYHEVCGISDCTLSGYHEHEGAYCFGHYVNDGHSYHNNRGHHR